MFAGAKALTTSPVKVRNGWRAPDGTRVRPARPGESAEFRRLLESVRNVQIEPGFLDGIERETLGQTVLERLRTRRADDMHREVASQFTGGNPEAGVVGLATALVVENRSRQLVGALLVHPPCLMIAQAVDSGRPLADILKLAVRIMKIKAMFVEKTSRGRGLGTALLKSVDRVYPQLGVRLLYGQFRDAPHLPKFFAAQGFDVLDRGAGVDLNTGLGLPMQIEPLDSERVFARWLP